MKAYTKALWNTLPDGRRVDLYTFTADDGASVSITDLGGGLIKIMMPDKDGNLGDCILGFSEPSDYIIPANGYLGLLVGRYANRLAGGRFTLNGETYQLELNDNTNTLHGLGRMSFNLWGVEEVGDDHIVLSFTSPDMEDGFPGKLDCTVTYTFTDDHAIGIEYKATSDKDTYVNFTNHAYFNLACDDSLIHDHIMWLASDSFTELNENNVPTGVIKSVKDNPYFDFTSPKALGVDIAKENPDLKKASGYDHNFCLDHAEGEFVKCGSLLDPKSGRFMEVWTDQPGIQIYTANFMPGIKGKYDLPVDPRRGVCFETQHYADSPNQPHFPSTLLKAGDTFVTKTEFRFSCK